MKGMYFVGLDNEVYTILSEPLVTGDAESCFIEVVVMRTKDNLCKIYEVANIGTLYTNLSQLPKEYID